MFFKPNLVTYSEFCSFDCPAPPATFPQFKGDMFYLFCIRLICNILVLDQENKYQETEWLMGLHFKFVCCIKQNLPPALASVRAPGSSLLQWCCLSQGAAVRWPRTLRGRWAVWPGAAWRSALRRAAALFHTECLEAFSRSVQNRAKGSVTSPEQLWQTLSISQHCRRGRFKNELQPPPSGVAVTGT